MMRADTSVQKTIPNRGLRTRSMTRTNELMQKARPHEGFRMACSLAHLKARTNEGI